MPLPRPSRHTPQEEAITPPPQENKLKKSDFRPSDVFRFDPKSDITAEELAYLVSIFWTLDLNYDRFFTLRSSLQRHFMAIKG